MVLISKRAEQVEDKNEEWSAIRGGLTTVNKLNYRGGRVVCALVALSTLERRLRHLAVKHDATSEAGWRTPRASRNLLFTRGARSS